MKFGAHVSIAGGIDKAPERAAKLGCECFQIFTRSPRGGIPPPLHKSMVDSFLMGCKKYGFTEYYVHTPYYVNLSSQDKNIRSSSISIINEELKRASALGVKYVMTHIGSAKDSGRSETPRAVIQSLRQISYKAICKTILLLENSAGQGATIGDTFEELAAILQDVGNPELGICLDTAHLFAAGYDIRTKTSLENVVTDFSSTVGLGKLKLLHGNDSKVGLGERKDRHEHIGEGQIGLKGFSNIVNHPGLKKVDLIVETPLEKIGDDIKNLSRLRELQR